MSSNPFDFNDPPRPSARPPRPRRPPASPGGSGALVWILGGVGALAVVAGVAIGVFLALGNSPSSNRGTGEQSATDGKSGGATEQTGGRATEAPLGGDLPQELVDRARQGMAYYDVSSSDGHRERGAAFHYAGDLMVGYDPISGKHKLSGQREYTDIGLNPEDGPRSPDDLHQFYPISSKGRCYLLIRNPNKLPPVPVAEGDPSTDDEVFVLGYTGGVGSKATFQVARATVGARQLTGGTDYSYDLTFVPPENFVFGGPVLDRQGRAVGAVLPPEPGKKTASLFPIDWVRKVEEGSKVFLDGLRKGPGRKPAPPPKPPEPPAAWETGGLDAAVFLSVKEGLGEVSTADKGFIVNWNCVTYISPDLVLTRGKINVGRRNGFVYKADYTVLESSDGRAWAGGKPKVELADDALNITVLRVEVKKRKPGLSLSTDEVKVGDSLWVLGTWQLPPGTPSKSRPFSARPTKVVSVAGAAGKSPVVELDFTLPKGEDGKFGGPVVDAKGRVVGVVLPIGKDEKTARMVPATAIRKVLEEKKLLGADEKKP